MKYIDIISLAQTHNCRIMLNEPLKNHTSFKIGGPADIFLYVNNENVLCEILKLSYQNEIPIFILGNGSNVVVNEKGFRGVIIRLDGDFKQIKILNNEILCGSAVSLAKACVVAMNHELSGLEFSWGIPGSCGGALYMNAGAYDGEISKIVKKSTHIKANGEVGNFNKFDFKFSYRKSNYTNSNLVITSMILSLNKSNQKEIKKKMMDLILKRKQKQPLEYPSAGSIFKRPTGYYVGTLIEECGLKGFSIGGAQVSEKHAGFIINKSDATSNDVLKLIKYVQNAVYKKIGITLEPEVKFLKEKIKY